MNTLKTVWAKELTDLFRDRRTVVISLLMGPLLTPALILGMSPWRWSARCHRAGLPGPT